MRKKLILLFFVFTVLICNFALSARPVHASYFGQGFINATVHVPQKLTEKAASVFLASSDFLSGLLTRKTPPSAAGSSPGTLLISQHVPASTHIINKYISTSNSGISESQFVYSLLLLENRLNAKINSTAGGGLTVPANIFVAPPNLSTLTPATLTVSGAATSTFASGINLASGCFSVAGTCIGAGGGGSSSWGGISGTLSNQSDLQTALNRLKQQIRSSS